MTIHAQSDTQLYVNALIPEGSEVRTRVFSKDNLDTLLGEQPAAITFSPAGVVDADRLLIAYLEHGTLFRAITRSGGKSRQWRCYVQRPHSNAFELKELVDRRRLLQTVVLIYRQHKQQLPKASVHAPICALVPDIGWTPERDKQIANLLCAVIIPAADSGARRSSRVPQAKHQGAAAVKGGAQKTDPSDREALLRQRLEMLEKVGWYLSEDLAAAAGSTTKNPSQLAADRRARGEIFGVRYGKEWRYPKFQFDSDLAALPEVKDVLQALSPDEQGWDRLQWFLEPHESLRGRSPLDMWKKDRQKVIEAANTERWDDRD